MSHYLWLLLALLLLLSLPAGAAEYLQLRAGLPHCQANFKPGGWLNAIFVGGDVTAGTGASASTKSYHDLSIASLRAAFPGAGIGTPVVSGGAGSWWGAHCAVNGQAVYGTHLPGSVLFVETAADDEGRPEAEVVAALEGLVRQVRVRAPITDVVFLYGLRPEWVAQYRQGQTPAVVQWQERVAERYGVPGVNLGLYAVGKGSDGTQNDQLHTLYAEAISAFVTQAKAAAPEVPTQPVMPAVLSPQAMVAARLVPYELATLSGKWLTGQTSPSPLFRHVAVCTDPQAVMLLKFKGAGVGTFEVADERSAAFEVSLDGSPWQLQEAQATAGKSLARQLAGGLAPDQWHELRLRVAAGQPEGRSLRLGCLLVDGAIEDRFAGLTPLQRLDALYETMDPLRYTPDAARWALIPRTMQKLREGGTLKMVLLGDSIVNQTSNSGFDLLVQRMYPQVKIERVTSVRGSTGCWWYKEENRVEEYVLKHTPDLLVIGGISQRNDVDSIREVIHQVRAKQQPEILLMTPAFGADGCDFIKEWTYDIRPGQVDYRGKLQALAAEEKCEFLDLTGPWWRYVQDSGRTYGWFRGDAVHANERGTQILARLLETYFGPK